MSLPPRSYLPRLEALETRLTPTSSYSFIPGTQFAPALDFGTAAYPYALASGDFNRDGLLDLAVSNTDECGDEPVQVFLGNGAGGFTQAPSLKGQFTSGDFIHLTAGDFDGDGDADLAVTSYDSSPKGNVRVYLSNGDGTFAKPRVFSSGGWGAASVVTGDLNGDGHLDLAVANIDDGSVGILLGDGAGSFSTSPECAAKEPFAQAVGDMDGDSDLDLVVGDYWGQVRTLFNHGDGTFCKGPSTKSVYSVSSLALGDFDSDGDLDVAAASLYDGTVIHDNLGDGTLDLARPLDHTLRHVSTPSVVAGDFNLDGRIDLATVLSGFNQVAVYSGNGDGSFAAPVFYPVGDHDFGQMLAADFDNDGDLDLAVVNDYDDSVSILLNLARQPGGAVPIPGPSPAADPFGLDVIGVNVLTGALPDEARLRLPFFRQNRASIEQPTQSQPTGTGTDDGLFSQYLVGGNNQTGVGQEQPGEGEPGNGITAPASGPVEETEAETGALLNSPLAPLTGPSIDISPASVTVVAPVSQTESGTDPAQAGEPVGVVQRLGVAFAAGLSWLRPMRKRVGRHNMTPATIRGGRKA